MLAIAEVAAKNIEKGLNGPLKSVARRKNNGGY
jgi:hypothetical protein